MATRIKLSITARRLGKVSFWRCGVEHTVPGAVFGPDQFTAAEWDRLRADEMLEVTELPGDGAPEPTPEEAAAALRARIRAAIARLSWDEFTRAGVPQLGAIRAVIPEAGTGELKPILLEVWADMVTEGFVRPTAPAPGTTDDAEPAPGTTDDTNTAPGTTGDTDTAPVTGDTEPAPPAGAAQDDAGAPEEA